VIAKITIATYSQKQFGTCRRGDIPAIFYMAQAAL